MRQRLITRITGVARRTADNPSSTVSSPGRLSSDLFSTTKYHVAPDKSALKQLERAVDVFQESLQSSTGHGGLYSDL